MNVKKSIIPEEKRIETSLQEHLRCDIEILLMISMYIVLYLHRVTYTK